MPTRKLCACSWFILLLQIVVIANKWEEMDMAVRYSHPLRNNIIPPSQNRYSKRYELSDLANFCGKKRCFSREVQQEMAFSTSRLRIEGKKYHYWPFL